MTHPSAPAINPAAILGGRPCAIACISAAESGGQAPPGVSGAVRFYQTKRGVLVYANIRGLPKSPRPCGEDIFGFHIHQGTGCGGQGEGAFPQAMSHFNPEDCPHPRHAGDLPPLLGCGGYAVSVFLTDRFSVRDIIGRVVIIHGGRDDFTSQPGGDSGEKIACGVIERVAGV